jgi:hypothetical protein
MNHKDVDVGIESRFNSGYGLAVRCYECSSEHLCSIKEREFLDKQNNSFSRSAVLCTVAHLIRM